MRTPEEKKTTSSKNDIVLEEKWEENEATRSMSLGSSDSPQGGGEAGGRDLNLI